MESEICKKNVRKVIFTIIIHCKRKREREEYKNTYETLGGVVHESKLESLLIEEALGESSSQGIWRQSAFLRELQLREQVLKHKHRDGKSLVLCVYCASLCATRERERASREICILIYIYIYACHSCYCLNYVIRRFEQRGSISSFTGEYYCTCS